jgi:hypothetical protein
MAMPLAIPWTLGTPAISLFEGKSTAIDTRAQTKLVFPKLPTSWAQAPEAQVPKAHLKGVKNLTCMMHDVEAWWDDDCPRCPDCEILGVTPRWPGGDSVSCRMSSSEAPELNSASVSCEMSSSGAPDVNSASVSCEMSSTRAPELNSADLDLVEHMSKLNLEFEDPDSFM